MNSIRRAATAVLLLAAVNLVAADSRGYRMQVLPIPAGCDAYSQWHGLAQNGVAVAIVSCEGEPVPKAVVWNGSTFSELPTIGGPTAAPYGVGRGGLVVGTADSSEMYDSEYHVTRPVIWRDGLPEDLGTLGGPLGGASAMNSSGTIVGGCQPSAEDPSLGRRPLRPCVWSGGVVSDLGDLGGPEAAAYDVNDRGSIVGSSTTKTPLPSGLGLEEHAFLYDGRSMQNLGTLGGAASLAWALNDGGEVVGYSTTAGPHPPGTLFLHAFVWRDGVMSDLGTLGGTISEALDINNRGEIVGWSRLPRPAGNSIDHAVLWSKDGMADLNDLVRDTQGCVLIQATAIDDAGRILANALCNWRARVVILTPHDSEGTEAPAAAIGGASFGNVP